MFSHSLLTLQHHVLIFQFNPNHHIIQYNHYKYFVWEFIVALISIIYHNIWNKSLFFYFNDYIGMIRSYLTIYLTKAATPRQTNSPPSDNTDDIFIKREYERCIISRNVIIMEWKMWIFLWLPMWSFSKHYQLFS